MTLLSLGRGLKIGSKGAQTPLAREADTIHVTAENYSAVVHRLTRRRI